MSPKNLKLRFSFATALIWLFPLLAIVSTATLYYKYFLYRGPLVEIQFSDAAGIETEKTVLRFRGVTVGKVEEIALSENGKGVTVFARLIREAEGLAVQDSKFAIVQPQVDFQGIRGLETLFRGSYIRITQGKGDPSTKFVGVTEGETDEPLSSPILYSLRSSFIDSINAGDPVLFRGLKIGEVVSVNLDSSARWVDAQIQIERKFVKVIRSNTVFWIKSGIEAKLGLFGSKVKVGSLESLMSGGIALATPDKPGKIADAGTRFELRNSSPQDYEKWSPNL